MQNISKISSKYAKQTGLCALLIMLPGIASATVASVPEPGPFGLLILGGVALVIARRFKRNK